MNPTTVSLQTVLMVELDWIVKEKQPTVVQHKWELLQYSLKSKHTSYKVAWENVQRKDNTPKKAELSLYFISYMLICFVCQNT